MKSRVYLRLLIEIDYFYPHPINASGYKHGFTLMNRINHLIGVIAPPWDGGND